MVEVADTPPRGERAHEGVHHHFLGLHAVADDQVGEAAQPRVVAVEEVADPSVSVGVVSGHGRPAGGQREDHTSP